MPLDKVGLEVGEAFCGAKLGSETVGPAGDTVVGDEFGADVGTDAGPVTVTGAEVGFAVPPDLGAAVAVLAGD